MKISQATAERKKNPITVCTLFMASMIIKANFSLIIVSQNKHVGSNSPKHYANDTTICDENHCTMTDLVKSQMYIQYSFKWVFSC